MNKYFVFMSSFVFLAVGIFIGFLTSVYIQGSSEKKKEEKIEGKVYKRIGEVVIMDLDISIAKSIPGVKGEDVEKSLMKLAIFYNEGRKLGLDRDSVIKRLQYWSEKSVLADNYYRKYVLPKIMVDTSKVLEFIEQNKDDFSREVAMLTVAFQDLKIADTIKKLLIDGSYAANLMLEEFARNGKISIQPSGYQNVGLGRFALGEEEYRQLRGAKKGDVIGPFSVAPGTYVLAKIVDTKSVDVKKLDSNVKGVIYQYLLESRAREVEDSVFNNLLKNYQ